MLTDTVEAPSDIKISRSLRIPIPMFEELVALAEARGDPWSEVVRQWIAEGLAEARTAAGREPDAVEELQRGDALITHAAQRLRRRPAA